MTVYRVRQGTLSGLDNNMGKKKRSAADVLSMPGIRPEGMLSLGTEAELLTITESFQTLDTWDSQKCREFIRASLWERWTQTQMDLFRDGDAIRGPRLPDGVTFADLLPHLAEALRVYEDRTEPFDTWVRAHKWPGGMKLVGDTVRYWLQKYVTLIDRYIAYRAQIGAIDTRSK